MQRIKFMIKLFLNEPLWFKILILTSMFISILFSSSSFTDNVLLQSLSKVAAAVFFGAYGFKMKRNLKVSIMFFILTGVCIYLSILEIQ
ncbi:hypothetical protein J2Y03_002366 [Neobacillus niacini]|uniref:hypothetical protein n=1 Tax=Neobacillus niacini TaxID=86668 RepID=UPI00104ADF0A|nr:hypothetical protein [Neobacillus niacini]MDR7077342.1 hypothetical protein [Neobacillus niacini]